MAPRDNQRRDARIEATIPVVLHRDRTTVRLVTVDVSYRGIFVETTPELQKRAAVRSLVKLDVELPTGGFGAHAMIVHAHESRLGLGLQFWALNGAPRKTWESFVRSIIDARRAALKAAATPVGPDSQVSGIRSVAPVASEPEIAVALQRATRR